MAKARLDVAIVGGGIGGLFAANALLAQGFRVRVYEQAPALGEIGAGVFLTPNSVRQLQRVGLGSAVETWREEGRRAAKRPERAAQDRAGESQVTRDARARDAARRRQFGRPKEQR